MKVPISWLKKYIHLRKDPKELAEILTISGLEVDKIDRIHFGFSGVVIVKILEIQKHPGSNKLKIVHVTDGKKKIEIVSGASDLEPNLVTALAKVGAHLPSPDGKIKVIEKAVFFDVASEGMLVSEKDLELSDDSANIIKLPHDAPLGEDLATYLYDPIFDIALTPNLGHCRSVLGIARELSLHILEDVHLPLVRVEESDHASIKSALQITNEEQDLCPQYLCRIIQGVHIEKSPSWLIDALEKAGYKSINNVVDITNYVMHELGQPLHAFDYDTIKSKHLVIRKARKNTSITTLDKQKRTLPEGALIISDGEEPAAIAGIMGGLESGISDTTRTIVLEAAQFKEISIRQSSKLLTLRTESSSRFENGIDPGLVKYALDRATMLIQEVAGGRVLKGVLDHSSKPYVPRFITCRLSRINSLLGTTLSLNEVESYLSRLGTPVSSDGVNLLQVRVPSARNDIREEIDLVEEIARIYGYNNIPKNHPKHVNSSSAHHPLYLLERRLRSNLVALGLQEFITCNLISQELANLEIENGLFNHEYIKVLHAKSEDQSILRPSLLPGLLSSILTNQNHGIFDVKAFEIGRVHFKEGDTFDEKPVLGIIMTGKTTPHHWREKPGLVDFYTLKGVIEDIAALLSLPPIVFEASLLKTFHPGRQAKLAVGEEVFGVLGEIHPSSLAMLGIKRGVYFAEIDLLTLEKYRTKKIVFAPLAQFPGSERDWTVQMDRETTLDSLFNAIDHLNIPLLKEAILIDIYMGEKVPQDKKNVTFRFIYRDDTKTIDVASIEKAHQAIIHTLERAI